jgi:FPC/CPF motif-containing protein YcgG
VKLASGVQTGPVSRGSEADKALEEFMLSSGFSCVGGKAAWRRDAVVHHHYGQLADRGGCRQIYSDLLAFTKSGDAIDKYYATFVASFDGPKGISETEFEELLWQELQFLHELDRTRYGWAPGVESDPASGQFAYSGGGKAFFIVGLHSNSSRLTRRFKYPTLVFNSHIQIDRIRENGWFERMRRVVRNNELALQGSLNPMLADFGEISESRQYSGRAVERDWRCPFSARTRPESRTTEAD